MHTQRQWLIAFIIMLGSIGSISGQDEIEVPIIQGQIAYVGADHNIYSLDTQINITSQITDDATEMRHYKLPTWAQGGNLAYFCCNLRFSETVQTEAFVSQDGRMPGELVFDAEDQDVIYASWSPFTCNGQDSCYDLALLLSDFRRGDLSIQLLGNDRGSGQQKLGFGSPFYYSWSSSGREMAWHRSGSFEVLDIETGQVTITAMRTSGGFQAPAWSPVDSRILYGAQGDDPTTTDLIIQDQASEYSLVAGLSGLVSFSWSPDGQLIAYRLISRGGIDELWVLDADTGEVVGQSNVPNVLAFFWSPDSQHLAYITPSAQPGTFDARRNEVSFPVAQPEANSFAWLVLNVEDGSNYPFSNLHLSPDMQYMVTYFDQFNQSHQIWSPDSSHIVYSEIVDSDSIIRILDVTSPDSTPITIAEGSFAVWSYR